MEDGHRGQLVLHKLVLEVLHVFIVAILDTLLDSVPGNQMQRSNRAEVNLSRGEDAQVVDRALLGSTSLTKLAMRRKLQLHPSNSSQLMEPRDRKTEGALCEYLLARQRACLEGTVTFPHMFRTSRIGGELRLSFAN